MDVENVWVDVGKPNRETQRWQALFACQICTYSFGALEKNKWGFNAAALLDEALDRQKLFLESQYNHNTLREDAPNQRTIALRCSQIPGSGLLLALVGKVCSDSEEAARAEARAYCRELVAVFPYDYMLWPACSAETFRRLAGSSILDGCRAAGTLARVKRFETQLRTQKGPTFVMGVWQTLQRSDDQVWRSLGGCPAPALLNISLRPTQLTSAERQVLWGMTQKDQAADSAAGSQPALPYDEWARPLLERRLSPWKKLFALQVQLAVPAGVSDSLVRGIGSALTRDLPEGDSPGFLVEQPIDEAEVDCWREGLGRLDILPGNLRNAAVDRITDIADLTEAHAVFRLPFPPLGGLPNVSFLDRIE